MKIDREKLENIRVVSATYLHDYVIRFVFSDGKIHDLDFYPFLSKVPQNPMVSKYLKLDLFKKFRMNGDNIFWNGYEMCFSFFTLYFGFDWGPIIEQKYYEESPVIKCIHFSQRPKRDKHPQKRKKELA